MKPQRHQECQRGFSIPGRPQLAPDRQPGAAAGHAAGPQFCASFVQAPSPTEMSLDLRPEEVDTTKGISYQSQRCATDPLGLNPLLTEWVQLVQRLRGFKGRQQRGHGAGVASFCFDANPYRSQRDTTSRGAPLRQRLPLFNGGSPCLRHPSGFPTSPRVPVAGGNSEPRGKQRSHAS